MTKLRLLIVLLVAGIIILSCNNKANRKNSQTNDSVTEDRYSNKEKVELDVAKIFQASFNGNLQVVQEALDNGFNPNTADENKRTALMLAAYNGHTKLVKLLIERGGDVNAVDNIDRTALMYASSGPFTTTVSSLLQAGAKPNLQEKEEKWTAVMMAAAEGQLEIVKVLVAFGADLNMVDVDGESSLDFADSRGHTAVVEYIKSYMKNK